MVMFWSITHLGDLNMNDITANELEVLDAVLEMLPPGQRSTTVFVDRETEAVLECLHARGFLKYVPSLVPGMPAIIARPDPLPDVACLVRQPAKRSPRGARRL
jgi:hypothetical protein